MQLVRRKSAHVRPPRPRILLIEDNLTQLDLYALALESTFDVLKATRGEAGRMCVLRERPDAVVIDAMLPDVSGLDLAARLLSNDATATTPIVVLTGDDAAYAQAEGMRGFDAVLRKPCPADVLVAVLQRAISLRTIR